MTKSDLRRAFILAYNSIALFIMEGRQGKNLEAAADGVVSKGCCLLICSSRLALPAFYLPRDGSTHNGAGPPTSITVRENVSQAWPQSQSSAGIFPIEILSSNVTLAVSSWHKSSQHGFPDVTVT